MEASLHDFALRLARHVKCRDTLAALCRISKNFREIFTPVLYQEIWFDRLSFTLVQHLCSLPLDSHLQYTERLHIGPSIWTDSGEEYEEVLETMRNLLKKMVALKALTLEGRLLRDFSDVDSEDKDKELSPLQYLFKLEHLEEVILISTCDDIMEFTWPIPRFANLRKLVLHRLERDTAYGSVVDIVEVLIASPKLTSLGLSLKPYDGIDNDFLRRLIKCYKEKNVPVLQLSELHLGFGCLPVGPSWAFPEEENYLDHLIDLSTVLELRLDNNTSNSEQVLVPTSEIHPRLFTRATQIRRISIERFSPDIVSLIQLLLDINPGTLNEIEVANYFETLEDPEEAEYWDEITRGKLLFSTHLSQIRSHHWRNLNYGMHFKDDRRKQEMSNSLLHNFVSDCTELQELSIPMDRSQIDYLKAVIMPRTKLHSLMIHRGPIADLKLPEMSKSDQQKSTKKQKLEHHASNRRLDARHEHQRLELAKEIFQHNRSLIISNPGTTSLRYLGIGIHVYCCLLATSYSEPVLQFPILGEDGEIVEEYQIVKLSPDQARRFDAVKRLYVQTIDFT